MASSTHNQELPNMYDNPTAAPPPTPSTQSSNHLATSAAAADVLSRLLTRLPPTLSLPTRRPPPVKSASPLPLVSFSDENPTRDALLSSCRELGFFQLAGHDIPSELALSAESEALTLFELTKEQKETYFPTNWPLGHDAGDEEDGDGTPTESFCLDAACSTESAELSLQSLREFTKKLEKVGLKIVELLASAVGFENPIGTDPTRFCSLMWMYKSEHGEHKPVTSGGYYPYIIGLQYQIRNRKISLMSDAGWESVSPQAESVLVTLGDIAHVWSNGKLKKVRGRAMPCAGDGNNCSRNISMSVFLTLPAESRVYPLLTKVDVDNEDEEREIRENEEQTLTDEKIIKREEKLFKSFSFEDYAWRVYHERLLFKDPLDRYRI